MELMRKPDDCEIFGWIFDYAAWMAWDEFQQNHTVDSRTGRSFMEGVIEYTPDDNEERIHQLEFIHLLCLLADGDKITLLYQGGEEQLTPLEVAINNVDKLEAILDKKSPLRKSVAEMRRLVKIQAVLALLRGDETERAKDLLAAYWPKQIKRTGVDKETVHTLTNMVGGKTNKAFDAAHSHDKFCQALMPILKQLHDRFKRPFLIEIIAKKKAHLEQSKAPPKHISCSQLKKAGGPHLWKKLLEASDKMVEEGRPSTSQGESSSSRSSPRRGRTLTALSTSEDEWSPPKRGRSIRSLKYGGTSKTASSTTKTASPRSKTASPRSKTASPRSKIASPSSKTRADKRELDSFWESEEEEEDSLKTRLNGGKSISSPSVDTTLGDVPGYLRHRKKQKSGSPTKRRPWSQEEEEELKLGINRFGVGKWAEINMAYRFNNRTNVQLKDKYRTLVNQGLLSN